MPQLRVCPKCKALLPDGEFRMLRGWPRRRARICELCEVEDMSKLIRRRRKRLHDEEERRRELYRNVAGE